MEGTCLGFLHVNFWCAPLVLTHDIGTAFCLFFLVQDDGNVPKLLKRIVRKNFRPPLPAKFDPRLAQLLTAMWSPEAADRPSMESVVFRLREIV